METVKEWQLFIFGVLWGLLLFRLLPMLIKDIVAMIKEIKKCPAVGTAEQDKKSINKYIITDSCKNFHNQEIERWKK